MDYSKAKLTMMPFLFKALSLALTDYPVMNSSVDEANKAIVQHARHNIGCAMNTPFGLVVPNVKDVARKSVMDIALELHRLQVLAQANHLSQDDITGKHPPLPHLSLHSLSLSLFGHQETQPETSEKHGSQGEILIFFRNRFCAIFLLHAQGARLLSRTLERLRGRTPTL